MRKMICINCPRGCRLQAGKTESGEWIVEGQGCPRGKTYAVREMTAPARIVTAVVPSDSPEMPWIPVRTDVPLAKPLIPDLLNRLYSMRAKTPVRLGDVLIPDVQGTGVKVIFATDCPATGTDGNDQLSPLPSPDE